MDNSFTPDLVGAAVSTVTQLAFSYVPGLNVKYAGLKKNIQNLVTAGIVLATTIAIYLAVLYKLFTLEGPLSIGDAIRVFFMTLVAKVTVGAVAPEMEEVKMAGLQRDEVEKVKLIQKMKLRGMKL